MKVVYTKTVIERLNDVRLEAKHANKGIEKVLITEKEATDLWYELLRSNSLAYIPDSATCPTKYIENVKAGKIIMFGMRLGIEE